MTTGASVHRLEVKPRSTRHKYKRYDITVTFIPETKEFNWSFEITSHVTFNGRELTADTALNAAHAEIDHLLDAQEERANE